MAMNYFLWFFRWFVHILSQILHICFYCTVNLKLLINAGNFTAEITDAALFPVVLLLFACTYLRFSICNTHCHD
jgi:hypothetical protein